jgi:AraC-like DNA-binding protein
MRHPPRQHLPRHPHDHGFAALLLTGGYVEAGDTGRHRLEPGDVLLHRAWESHLDSFDRRGAEVLVLAIPDGAAGIATGRCADPDAVVRLAEHDPDAAAGRLLAELAPKSAAAADWPGLLAQALRADPSLSLTDWADGFGLHSGSLSRGFRQVFGTTPVAYRLAQRTRRAIDALVGTRLPISAIAQDSGFADQAHLCRAIGRLAHTTPAALRRRGATVA